MIKSTFLLFIITFLLVNTSYSQDDGFISLTRKTSSNLKDPNVLHLEEIGYTVIFEQNLKGLQNSDGKLLIPVEYESIKANVPNEAQLVTCRKGKLIDIYDLYEKQFIAKEISEIIINRSGTIHQFRKNDKYGLFWTGRKRGIFTDSPIYQTDEDDYGVIVPAVYDQIDMRYKHWPYMLLHKDGRGLDLLAVEDNQIEKLLIHRKLQLLELNLVDYEITLNNYQKAIRCIRGISKNDNHYYLCMDNGKCSPLQFSSQMKIANFPRVQYTTMPIDRDKPFVPMEYLVFNQISKFLELSNTILIDETQGKFTYTYSAEELPSWDLNSGLTSRHLRINPQHFTNDRYSIRAQIKTGESQQMDLLFLASFDHVKFRADNKNATLTVKTLVNEETDGAYKEFYENGQMKLRGEYCIVYENRRDTVLTIDPATYESKIEINDTSQHAEKCGTWTTYDRNGIVIKEEEY